MRVIVALGTGIAMQISFVNHACVKISIGDLVILCDPWIEGPAFNFGWDLLVKTPMSIDEIMQGVTHIWVSHEHPDHFAPKFFGDIAARYASSVPVLFQWTRDQRVRSFLTGRGFRVIELVDRKPHVLGGVRVTCGCEDFYDSWLHVTDGRSSVLNINDCGVSRPAELAAIARLTAPLDLLMTQFSYAAWKGGRANADFRTLAAKNKLTTITAQVRALKPRYVVPFASFVYFSNEENSYLNDRINTPEVARECIAAAGSEPVIMFPGDRWTVGQPLDDAAARAAYRQVYDNLHALPLRGPGESVPLSTLEEQFHAYRRRMFAQNSPVLIKCLRRLPVLGAFRPVTIRLTDLAILVRVSITDGFEMRPTGPEDVAMHSSSLSFIFNNAFGYDTLTVNGRFEATPEGFSKMTKSLALGSLNAMGLAVSPRLAFNFKVVLLLLRRLTSVVREMTQGGSREQARGAGP
jgi:UDP-MurNAc hydroxylase